MYNRVGRFPRKAGRSIELPTIPIVQKEAP